MIDCEDASPSAWQVRFRSPRNLSAAVMISRSFHRRRAQKQGEFSLLTDSCLNSVYERTPPAKGNPRRPRAWGGIMDSLDRRRATTHPRRVRPGLPARPPRSGKASGNEIPAGRRKPDLPPDASLPTKTFVCAFTLP